jgi:hypothetical protein
MGSLSPASNRQLNVIRLATGLNTKTMVISMRMAEGIIYDLKNGLPPETFVSELKQMGATGVYKERKKRKVKTV